MAVIFFFSWQSSCLWISVELLITGPPPRERRVLLSMCTFVPSAGVFILLLNCQLPCSASSSLLLWGLTSLLSFARQLVLCWLLSAPVLKRLLLAFYWNISFSNVFLWFIGVKISWVFKMIFFHLFCSRFDVYFFTLLTFGCDEICLDCVYVMRCICVPVLCIHTRGACQPSFPGCSFGWWLNTILKEEMEIDGSDVTCRSAREKLGFFLCPPSGSLFFKPRDHSEEKHITTWSASKSPFLCQPVILCTLCSTFHMQWITDNCLFIFNQLIFWVREWL